MKNSSKPVAVIAVRLGSSRLPGKAMLPVLGRPMIERMVERIARSKYVGNTIVLATTNDESDTPLEELARQLGIHCFRGDEDNVLNRIFSAVSQFGGGPIVELLGDNPLVHSDLIDETIEFFYSGGFAYTATVTNEYPHADPALKRFPVGIRVQVFSWETLSKTEKAVTQSKHKEHSTSYIYENPENFKLGYLECSGKWEEIGYPEFTFAVNYEQNFELISVIFEELYPEDPNFSLQKAVAIVKNKPDLLSLMGPPKG